MLYMVECYLPAKGDVRASESSTRARAAAHDLAREGAQVRFVRSIYVPQDETFFLLYEAQSADLAAEANARAGLEYERIVEALDEEET